VAAIVLRAVVAAVGDPERRTRSATFQYLRPPTAGPVRIEVTLERTGRSVTNASARMTQDGRTLVLALVALAVDREPRVSFDEDAVLPMLADGTPVPSWADASTEQIDADRDVPMRRHYDLRWVLGDPPFEPGPGAVARCGGWMRLIESPVIDEVTLVAMADAWLPPIFSRTTSPVAVPTVDLTVHFRGRPTDDSGWVFVQFASPVARDGHLVEHGTIRDPSGRLLADTRQLAIVADAGPPGRPGPG
jgi:acyl-CoA thioesterase